MLKESLHVVRSGVLQVSGLLWRWWRFDKECDLSVRRELKELVCVRDCETSGEDVSTGETSQAGGEVGWRRAGGCLALLFLQKHRGSRDWRVRLQYGSLRHHHERTNEQNDLSRGQSLALIV